MMLLVYLCISVLVISSGNCEECHPRKYKDGTVCVCSSTNCGFLPKIETKELDYLTALVYTSTAEGKRFEKSSIEIDVNFTLQHSKNEVDLHIQLGDASNSTIMGFGGAITDAAGINWASLESEQLKRWLIQSYYGDNGLEYNMARIPMGGCDFSTRDYTYDDVPNDFDLKNFALAPEDLDYKIPIIQQIDKLADKRNENVRYIAAPWSAPAWMKNTNTTYGRSWLNGEPGGKYYKTWAQYFVKFHRAYKEHGVDIWGYTIQNEPTSGYVPGYPWQTMAMSPTTMKDFLKTDLGPALFKETNNQSKILIFDDSRYAMASYVSTVLNDPEANQYTAGIGFHWYYNHIFGGSTLRAITKDYPNKFLLSTEACVGPFQSTKVKLGSWDRGDQYAKDIYENLKYDVAGWIDWNLFLDTKGGPNWAKNFVDSPIIVNATAGEFYKQPMYYALAHFSKFIPRGSRKMEEVVESKFSFFKKPFAITFQRPDLTRTSVIINPANTKKLIQINDPDRGILRLEVPPNSYTSVIWSYTENPFE